MLSPGGGGWVLGLETDGIYRPTFQVLTLRGANFAIFLGKFGKYRDPWRDKF